MNATIESGKLLKYKILVKGKILIEDIASYDVAQIFLSKLEESVRDGAIVMGYTTDGKSLLMENMV